MFDLQINFWLLLGIKVAVIVGAVALPLALVVIFGELKISAHMQSRIGPYFAGGRFGWAQPLADGLKFLQKEDLVPEAADSSVYRLAPQFLAGRTRKLDHHKVPIRVCVP